MGVKDPEARHRKLRGIAERVQCSAKKTVDLHAEIVALRGRRGDMTSSVSRRGVAAIGGLGQGHAGRARAFPRQTLGRYSGVHRRHQGGQVRAIVVGVAFGKKRAWKGEGGDFVQLGGTLRQKSI